MVAADRFAEALEEIYGFGYDTADGKDDGNSAGMESPRRQDRLHALFLLQGCQIAAYVAAEVHTVEMYVLE